MSKKAFEPDATDNAFMALITEDQASIIGHLNVDSGTIELGDCDKVQIKTSTALGDGVYPVWKGKKYIVIEHDMLSVYKLNQWANEEDTYTSLNESLARDAHRV